MVFGLFMFGFDGDDPSVFEETVKFNIDANYDACAYSVLTPYPGTLTWYEMKKANRIVSFDWEQVRPGQRRLSTRADVRRRAPAGSEPGLRDVLRAVVHGPAVSASRRPRSRLQWSIYNLFMKKGAATDRKDAIAAPTAAPDVVPMPPILPLKREWREAVLEGTAGARPEHRHGSD